MVSCDRCGRDVDLPFRCNYCGGYYCSDHRLPEFHECTGFYQRRKTDYYARGSTDRTTDYAYQSPRRGSDLRSLFKFSEKEIEHLGISLVIIAALPLMWLRGYIFSSPAIAVGAVLIFAAAFLLHELAHKFMAQRLGYWAEFRLNQIGLAITLLSFISPFKLVAPGAVMIAGLMYGDDYGKISLAGPITNIAQAILFLLLGFTTGSQLFSMLAYVGVVVNSSLALFNLLPFGVFDGAKIMRWDWRAWLAATGAAAILYLYASL